MQASFLGVRCYFVADVNIDFVMLRQTWCKFNNATVLRFWGICISCHFYVIPFLDSSLSLFVSRSPFTFCSVVVLSPCCN